MMQGQRGDTIIEVLLAMVIVGLTLGIGFNIAQRAQQTGQNARERVEAVNLAESQLELLKANLSRPDSNTFGYDGTDYCILSSGLNAVTNASDSASDCYEIQDVSGADGFYRLRMDYFDPDGTVAGDEYYISRVEWDVPNSPENSVVELRYRTYE